MIGKTVIVFIIIKLLENGGLPEICDGITGVVVINCHMDNLAENYLISLPFAALILILK